MLPFWLTLLLLASCSSTPAGAPSPESPAAGSERGPCYGNGTCDEGLSCLSDLCVQEDAPGGSGGAVAGAGGTVEPGGSGGSSTPAGSGGEAGTAGGAGAPPFCTPWSKLDCTCDDGGEGLRTCKSTGLEYGPCTECQAPPGGAGGEGGAPVCPKPIGQPGACGTWIADCGATHDFPNCAKNEACEPIEVAGTKQAGVCKKLCTQTGSKSLCEGKGDGLQPYPYACYKENSYLGGSAECSLISCEPGKCVYCCNAPTF